MECPKLFMHVEDKDKFLSEAFDLIEKIRPEWKRESLRNKYFTEGISNTLMGVYKEGNKEDMVLIRVYGNNTEKMIDRDAEKRNMKLFSDHGCGSKIYAEFANGIAYEYIPGVIFTKETVRDPKYNQKIIEERRRSVLFYLSGYTKHAHSQCAIDGFAFLGVSHAIINHFKSRKIK